MRSEVVAGAPIRATWDVRRFKVIARNRREPYRATGENLPHLSLSAYTGLGVKEWDDENRERSTEELGAYWIVRPGDLVVNPMWLHNSGVAVSGLSGVVSPAYRVYAFQNESHPRYYHHLFRSQWFLQQYARYVRGSTTYDRSVGREDFEGLEVPVPPRHEQEGIAAFLDHETRRINDLIAKKRRLIELLEEKRKALIDSALWESRSNMLPLRRLTSSIRDGTHAPPPEEAGDYRLLSVRNMIDGWLTLLDDDRRMGRNAFLALESSYSVRSTDVVLAVVGGTTGKVARVPPNLSGITVQRSTAIIRPDPKKATTDFLYYWLQSGHVQQAIDTVKDKYAAQPGIYLEDVANLPAVSIPVSSQRAIVSQLESDLSDVASLTTMTRNSVTLLEEKRSALITAAVTGQLDVSTWTPPAQPPA